MITNKLLNRITYLFIASCLLALFFQQSTIAESPYIFTNDETININVYNKVAPSVVSITANIAKAPPSGSGVFISSYGIILTSSHVVKGAKSAFVKLPSGKVLNGEIISLPNYIGLSLIDLHKNQPIYSSSIISNQKDLKIGQKVFAIGNPFGFERTLTTGIISRIDLSKNKIQTNATINPGSSGGPLLNTKGEIIGINESIYNPDNSYSNIGISFAIPIYQAINNINQYLNTKLQSIEP